MLATYAQGSTISTARPAGSARIAFLLLFPGFFFYQTLIGMGAMGAFLGGYFAIVSIALFFPLGYAYWTSVRKAGYRVAPADLKFGFFLAYFFLVVAINAGFGADPITVQTHLLSILYFVNIYLIFKNVDFSDRKSMGMALVPLLLMSATIFYFSQGGSFQPGQVGDPRSPDSVATYQELARSYALTFVAVICFTSLAVVRLALYCVAIAALFLNGARSELVAVLFVIPMVELYRAKNWLHVLCIVLVAVAVVTVDPHAVMQSFPESRVWELFDLSRSTSVNARQELTQHALHTIAEHPVLGDYASYPPGGYSHNILSAWVDLGIFGFAYMLFMLLHTTVKLFLGGWLVRARSGHFLLAWSLICMSMLLLLTAKTFDDMFAGAAMGAYANYRSRKRRSGSRG
jgi:hypothetical protein